MQAAGSLHRFVHSYCFSGSITRKACTDFRGWNLFRGGNRPWINERRVSRENRVTSGFSIACWAAQLWALFRHGHGPCVSRPVWLSMDGQLRSSSQSTFSRRGTRANCLSVFVVATCPAPQRCVLQALPETVRVNLRCFETNGVDAAVIFPFRSLCRMRRTF